MPLNEQQIFVFLFQFSVILLVARTLGELTKRLNQPPVVGEILAGVLLGPSILGAVWPGFFHFLFPHSEVSHYLLEITAWLGMVMLLLVTGLETDIKIMNRLGRPALILSGVSLVVPLMLGVLIAMLLPAEAMAGSLGKGPSFVMFVGLAFSISAVPLLAKILLDLKLMERDLGPALLGAAMFQAAVGWIMLSIVTSVIHGQGGVWRTILFSLLWTGLFLGFAYKIGFPLIQAVLRWVDDHSSIEHGRLSIAMFFTLLYASFTQIIGIHAIFGAFVAGVTLIQSPRMRKDIPNQIRGMSEGIFGPIFFAYAGLNLDLSSLKDLDWFAMLFGVAIIGKVAGGYVGARMGGFRLSESLMSGIALNARGEIAMVLALIGLNLNVISTELFSIIVLIALATSLMTPPLLRLFGRFMKVTTDEAERLEQKAQEARALFKGSGLKALMATSGGPNPLGALALIAPLVKSGSGSLMMMAVRQKKSFWDQLKGMFRKPVEEKMLETHLGVLKKDAVALGITPETKVVTSISAPEAITAETERGYDVLVLGASTSRHPLASAVLGEVVDDSACDVLVMKRRQSQETLYKKILVPFSGNVQAQKALELAALYAQATGAQMTVFHIVVPLPPITARAFEALGQNELFAQKEEVQALMKEEIQRVTAKFKINIETKMVESYDRGDTIIEEAKKGGYDLIVVGATHHILKQRLFFGNVIEDVVHSAPCSVAVITPKKK